MFSVWDGKKWISAFHQVVDSVCKRLQCYGGWKT